MKLNTKQREVSVGGVSEVGSFKVEMNAMMFHSVIDGIYADKISSPFRELCTNARDGHSANGNLDEPFDVFLPSMINPTFKVRDYGIGLSHEDVMGLYSTMFASSKRDSNDAVGMIGLGSKSPFAYTSAFTVTSYYDGMARTYSAFIGSEGVPQIALMHEQETNARGGMEVQFPVKQEDIKKFREAAPRVLFGFAPFPNILNETFTRTEPVVQYSGSNWIMYRESGLPFNTLMARQGCVLYPINPTPLGVTLAAKRSYGTQALRTIYEWPVVIDFPIGELDVATSREALGYTAKTIENLKAGIDRAMNEMTTIIDAEVRAASTYLDACIIASEARTGGDPAKRDLFNMLFSRLTWNDRPLIESVSADGNSKTAPFHWYDPRNQLDTFWGNFQPGIGFRPRKYATSRHEVKFMKNLKIYVEFEGLKNGPARMRRVIAGMAGNKNTSVFWVRPVDRVALDAFITSLGSPEWTDLETIEPQMVAREKTDKESPLTRLRYTTTTTNYAYNANTYEYIKPTEDMYYIKQVSGQFYIGAPNDPPMVISAALEWLRKATAAGLLAPGVKVYFLNSLNIKVLEKVNMKPVGSLIMENAKKLDFNNLITQSDAGERNRRTKVAQDLLSVGKTMPKDLKVFAETAAKQTPVSAVSSQVHEVLRRFCPQELDAALKQTDSIRQTWEDLRAKYPLLMDCMQDQVKLSHYMELISK